jgi:prepilin-type N-terminal cleavage/methylation domain-containing protein
MSERNAFTLIEVMIVLTIVVSVMAIAWPRMRGLAAKTQIREAAIEFKAACIEARDRSVRSGKPVYLRYKLGLSKFRLSETEQMDAQPGDTIQVKATGVSGRATQVLKPYSQEYELAIGIIFDDPANLRDEMDDEFGVDALVDRSGQNDPEQLEQQDKLVVGEKRAIDWAESEVITFYPEGRSTSAVVRILASDSGDAIMLSVRGLTAGVKVGDVERPLKTQQFKETPAPPAMEAGDGV